MPANNKLPQLMDRYLMVSAALPSIYLNGFRILGSLPTLTNAVYGGAVNYNGDATEVTGSVGSLLANLTSTNNDTGTSELCCVILPNAEVIGGGSTNVNVNFYMKKSFFDGVGSGFGPSYFGRQCCLEIGGTCSTYASDSSASLSDQINDMAEIYEKGGWVSAANGQPCFGGAGFTNATGNGVPEIVAYWNFQDQSTFRTQDAISGGPVTFTDLSGNNHNASMTSTVGGISDEALYEQAASFGTPYMCGVDWANGTEGQGANYAEVGSTINMGGDVTIIFYAGERTTNTTSTAARYIWDARPGGGDYMLTNSSGNAFNWQNAISGGSTSITSQPHFMTALAAPGDTMRIDVTYGGGSVPNYKSPNFFQNIGTTSYVTGANTIGADFHIASNGNNPGASMYPGPFQVMGIAKVPIATWDEDMDNTSKTNLVKILHYHHRHMVSGNYT